MKYYLFTLGCQMNIADSQKITNKLNQLGWVLTSEKESDLIIINACSVRQSAVDRIWGKINNWPDKEVLITGCVLDKDRKQLSKKGILFFETVQINILNQLLSKYYHTREYDSIAKKKNLTKSGEKQLNRDKLNRDKREQIAYVSIMTGCDNFCSYCVVPYTRGREKSRPTEEIIDEVKEAIKNGAREILLLGQNVNSFKIKNANLNPSTLLRIDGESVEPSKFKATTKNLKQKENHNFIKLLKQIDYLSGDFKFNFISSNPHDFSDELILVLARLKKWTRELHLAMQSGDDEILNKMNRKYTSGQYLALISKLKAQISKIKISTDLIVGFPGETDEQFQNTVKLVKKIGFNKAYIAQYSPRAGTASAKFPDDVPMVDKKKRWKLLDDLINKKDSLPR